MRPRIILVIATIVCGILFFSSTNAKAEWGWYTATVEIVASTDTLTTINCSHVAGTPLFTDRWFQFSQNNVNRKLAVALTAISKGSIVDIYTNPVHTGYPHINGIAVHKDDGGAGPE